MITLLSIELKPPHFMGVHAFQGSLITTLNSSPIHLIGLEDSAYQEADDLTELLANCRPYDLEKRIILSWTGQEQTKIHTSYPSKDHIIHPKTEHCIYSLWMSRRARPS